LEKQVFHCAEDALAALRPYQDWVVDVEVKEIAHYPPGKRKASTPALRFTYQLVVTTGSNLARYQKELEEQGFFTIATSQTDETILSPIDLLNAYKGRHLRSRAGGERFSILKRPVVYGGYVFC